MRRLLVVLHRYAGLVLAGFLVIAGLTGSLLAWNHELEAALSPRLFKTEPPHPGAPLLDPLLLRERVEARYPGVGVRHVRLALEPHSSAAFFLESRPDPVTGIRDELPNNQVFLNPYTGEWLGERKWGDITQGMKNLMPFIYRLHYSLALGAPGELVFGIVSLIWTLDCFIGAWLTMPARAPRHPRPWLARWWPAWTMRWRSGSYKLNVDLHRVAGLWPWAMLLVLAWSGVAFNLAPVYKPVMAAAFAHQPGQAEIPLAPQPDWQPRLSWNEARETGRRLMTEAARTHHFTVMHEAWLSFDAARAAYRYDVRSDRDIRDPGGDTSVYFDANTGALHSVWLPTGAASGDTIRTWITSLHMAALWGVPMKTFVFMMGIAVTMLSITGVFIWRKKHAARRYSSAQRRK